jgi:hypothetical protein
MDEKKVALLRTHQQNMDGIKAHSKPNPGSNLPTAMFDSDHCRER